jgi:integrase/recombinase XerD
MRPGTVCAMTGVILLPTVPMPAMIQAAGPGGSFAWDEFFSATLPNAHTRKAYRTAVLRFLAWAEPHEPAIARITPGLVGHYFTQFDASLPTKKLHRAALKSFFDRLCLRHVCVLNPVASVRTERFESVEGKTPEISVEQARTLLASIRTDTLVGKRDKAIIGILTYTAARAGAIAKLKIKQFEHDGTQDVLKFEEKGGKSREIPCRHDLQAMIRDYVEAAGLRFESKDAPLFRTAQGRRDRLTSQPMTGIDLCRMVKRRLRDAGLPKRLSPHSFRVAVVTNLLSQNVPLEEVQFLAGHADPRTTRLYDRRQRKVTRNIVERITI